MVRYLVGAKFQDVTKIRFHQTPQGNQYGFRKIWFKLLIMFNETSCKKFKFLRLKICFKFIQILIIQIIFIAESHRPIDVCNIYNDGQIRLLMKADENDGKLTRLK